MRKIFGGALALSVLGATVLGGALAWNDTQEELGVALVGTVDWELNAYPTANVLGPNGAEAVVSYLTIENTGTALTNFNIKFGEGTVVIGNLVGDQTCNRGNFSGTVRGLGLDYAEPIAPGNLFGSPTGDGSGYEAVIRVNDNAPESCMGALVSYAIQVEVETVNGLGQ